MPTTGQLSRHLLASMVGLAVLALASPARAQAATAPAPALPPTPTQAMPAAPAPAPKPAAPPSAVIKINDDSSLRFGFLLQTQADWAQDAATRDYAQNLFIRRVRLLVGGNLGKHFAFFVDTDNPNLGKSTGTSKTISSGFILQDAFVEFKPTDDFILAAGLIIIPLCRNCLQSATNLFALDYSPFSFLNSVPSQSVTGRDTGFMVKAYAFEKHLEVRAGGFQGQRLAGSHNAFRFAGRAQYSFWDPDVTQMFYAGTTFGSRKMLVVGGGVDTQDDYTGLAGDVYLERKVGSGVLTAQFGAVKWDGGTFFRTLPEQMTTLTEAGYYFPRWKFAPYVQVTTQRFEADAFAVNDQTRVQVGGGYYIRGHNANVKAAYTRVNVKDRDGLNGFTVQLQFFFY